ncbi:hypothetical protein AURANDRAFT_11784, partial [Aureococcus anophagefferens]
DGQVAAAGKFRAEGRVPALTWGDARDGASVWRASQPKVGVAGATSASDEALVRAIASADGGERRARSRPLCEIIDCRPRSSASANKLGGYGTEDRDRYKECRLSFAGRSSLGTVSKRGCFLRNACARNTHVEATLNISCAAQAAVRRLLRAAWHVADRAHRRRCRVLVHCSHGWDRTSQVAALAQLLLDAECRTMRGFARLVEKDFVAFGHPFATRLAHGRERGGDRGADDQAAPILVQFLDAAFQLTALFPEHFEFGSAYLVAVADAAHGCRFGTFLFDTEGDREAHAPHAPSLWAYLDHNRAHFASAAYRPPAPDLAARAPTSEHALLPPLTVVLRGVGLWRDYFLRYSP